MEIVNWLPLLLPLFAQQVHGDATPVDNGRGAFDAGDYGSHPNQTFVPSCIVAPLFSVSAWDRNATDDAP